MSDLITLPEYKSDDLYPHTKRLSSSQFLKYEKDPAEFFAEYVLGVKQKSNPKMLAGSAFSYLYEHRDFPITTFLKQEKVPAAARLGDLFERCVRQMPVLPAEVEMICGFKGWEFRATLDGYAENDMIIIENKTGGATRAFPDGWTQERVNFDDQLTFQAWCHWQYRNVIPKKILLQWVDTRPSAKQPLTTFKTTRSTKNLKNFEKRVETVITNLEAGNFTNPLYA
jgi:hypothetical protein